MTTTTTGLMMTAEEFGHFVPRPENEGRIFELVRGRIEERPRPGIRHGVVCANITTTLMIFVRQRRKGYVCSNDSGVILERDPDTVRGSDVMFYDEITAFDQLPVKWDDKLPRLAIEVLSPDDRPTRVARKVMQYLRRGIPLVWVADPEERTITVYKPNDFPRVLDEHEELTGNEVLPEFRCRVGDFFFLPGDQPSNPSSSS